jgi:hypothetical protein
MTLKNAGKLFVTCREVTSDIRESLFTQNLRTGWFHLTFVRVLSCDFVDRLSVAKQSDPRASHEGTRKD